MQITVRYVPIPITGTVFAGMGLGSDLLTCGIPMPNTNDYMPDYLYLTIQWTKSQPYKLSESHECLMAHTEGHYIQQEYLYKKTKMTVLMLLQMEVYQYILSMTKWIWAKKHKSNDLVKIKIKKQKTQSSYTEGSHHDKSEIVHIQSSVNDVVICPMVLYGITQTTAVHMMLLFLFCNCYGVKTHISGQNNFFKHFVNYARFSKWYSACSNAGDYI